MLMGKPVRSPRYTKTPRTPRSAHAQFYYTPSLIVHSPRVGSPNESGCESTANLMENHSRSASPREAPRPQHRPPSPPTPPTVPSAPAAPTAFDNRAYQHDEADQNHNDSFTSTNPQNGHSKEPNGETRTPEAVNLELINLTPKNGNAKKKDVEVDMNSANPYDEYFVSVNEHRKYMRGEKLYVTADKRGEKGGCKRPLCWTLLALVIAAVIALIVLAATGVLSSSSPTAVDQYNSSLSSARAFGGLTPSEHDHDHDHAHGHNHDHGHEHDYEDDHDAHDGHDHTDNASDEPNVAQNDEEVPAHEESNESAMYVPRTLEGQLRIDNEVYTQALSDPDSEDYHQFIATFGEELRRALFNRSMLEDNDNDINVQVIELRNGSVIVTYRLHWNPKSGLESPTDLMTASSLKTNLNKYLATNNRMISVYHIAEDKMQASNVLDLCHINNNDCSHGCIFDEKSLDFICTCPRGQILDMHNSKKCISIFEYSDQIHNQEPKNEVRVLENSNSESKENSPNPISVNVADREHTIDWKNNGPASEESTTESEIKTTHFSHVFGQPEEPESSEPKSSGESEPKLESKPSEPEPTAEPKAEPEPTVEPKAEPEPTVEPKAEPEPTVEPNTEPEPTAQSKAEPEYFFDHKAEPEPNAEPKAEPEFSSEHKAEPEPSAEPKPEPEPSVEIKLEPETFADSKAEPKPSAEPKVEPEPTAEPKAEPELTTEPKSEPGPSSELKSEHTSSNLSNPKHVLTPESKSEPEPTAEPEPAPEPTSEPKAVFEPAPKSNLTPELNLQTKQHPIFKPEFIIQSVTTPDAKQETTPEPKYEPEPNAEPNPQTELAATTKTVHELTAESQSERTPTSTAKNSYEPEPTFISSLAGIIGVEPEHVFLQESEHSEDLETAIKTNTNNPIVIQNQSLTENASERNTSLNRIYLERKPTDYFNILKYVNGEMQKPIDTTTITSPMVQNKSDENNSDDKDPAFFAIFQQDNEPITDINLKTTKNKTETFDLESTTVMESSIDALHDQVNTNLMGEFPEKMHKTSNHMYLNNMPSTIKHDNQTTDENVDPLSILLNDKSISESTTTLSTMPSNSNTKEDFISGPLIEATTIAVSKEPRETAKKETSNRNDSASSHFWSEVTENPKISFIIDNGTFLDTKDIKQTENVTELEPVTESFITDDENSTETQEVGANSEKKNGLQPNLATTENTSPENTEITFNMLLNRSSKAIVDTDFSNQTSVNVKMTPVNDTTTMDSDWLSEPITEISYEHLMNKMDNQLTTESSANAVAQVINGGHINDFEPDYLTHLGPTYAPEPNELLYTAMSDYDSQEARVKRVNQEEKLSEIVTTINPKDTVSHSLLYSKGAQKVHNTSEMPTENNNNKFTTLQYLNQDSHNEPINKATVNTINEYIHRTTEEKQNNAPNGLMKNSTVNTVSEYIHKTTEKQQSEPAPVWEEPDLVKETSTKETLTASGEQKPFPAAPSTMANPENNSQVNVNQVITSTQISNLNVTIYEKPSNHNQTLTTTKSPTSHSTEYDDHEKETNPFLPEVENNNHLVKKLQEGHDLEPSNLNDTQNDNTNEHSTLILDSIKSSSHNESSVKFSSSHQTIPATTTEEEDSFDDLLRESSNEPNPKTTEPEIIDGDENINDDGLPLSTFLLDTDDLDVQTHKSTDSERIVEDSHFTTNLPEAEDDDYLSVIPTSLHGKSSEEREVSKKKYKSENIEEINDIIVDFSQKKSDKRTFHELNTSK